MKLPRCILSLTAAVLVAAWFAPGATAADAHAAPAAHGAAHGGAAEQGDEPANPLSSFKTDLAIWTAVVFLVLFFILWKLAWGPIADGLDKRERYIAAQIAQAEKNNVDARQLLEEHQKKLAGAQGEVRGILDQARREAEQAGREMIEKARVEAQREQQKAIREIEQASAGAQKELAERSAALAVTLAGKIVGAKLQPSDHAALIARAVADFAQTKPSNN